MWNLEFRENILRAFWMFVQLPTIFSFVFFRWQQVWPQSCSPQYLTYVSPKAIPVSAYREKSKPWRMIFVKSFFRGIESFLLFLNRDYISHKKIFACTKWANERASKKEHPKKYRKLSFSGKKYSKRFLNSTSAIMLLSNESFDYV